MIQLKIAKIIFSPTNKAPKLVSNIILEAAKKIYATASDTGVINDEILGVITAIQLTPEFKDYIYIAYEVLENGEYNLIFTSSPYVWSQIKGEAA